MAEYSVMNGESVIWMKYVDHDPSSLDEVIAVNLFYDEDSSVPTVEYSYGVGVGDPSQKSFASVMRTSVGGSPGL